MSWVHREKSGAHQIESEPAGNYIQHLDIYYRHDDA